MIYRLDKENAGQRGTSLLEIIIALAIVGILTVGIATFTAQTISESQRSSFHMQAIQALDNTGFWIGRDVQMAQTVTPGPDAGFPLQLNWIDKNDDEFQVTFSINGNQMQRSLVKNGEAPLNNLVAQSIDASLTSGNYTDGLLTLDATATIGDVSLSRVYQIKKRPW